MGVLRLLLAVAVFAFHVGITESLGFNSLDGGAAVFCFFVVSGFYMEMVLTEKYTRERLGDDWAKKFWLARFWRLYPTWIFVAAATVLLAATTPYVQLPQALTVRIDAGMVPVCRMIFTWFSNVSMLFLNLPSTNDLLVGPGWSLGVEVAFYAIAPFALKLRARGLWLLALTGIALQLVPYGQHAPLLFGFHFFLLGALSRRYTKNIQAAVNRLGDLPLWTLYALTFLLIFVALPHDISFGRPDEHAHNTLDRFVYPLAMFVLVPVLHERSKNNRFDFWTGQLSYPFYLIHVPLIHAFSGWQASSKSVILLLLCLALSLLLMNAEVRFVEPWRSRFAR